MRGARSTLANPHLIKNMWQQWTNVILGLGLIAVPFLGMTGNAYTWALVITGIAVAALGVWGAQDVASEREAGRMATQH